MRLYEVATLQNKDDFRAAFSKYEWENIMAHYFKDNDGNVEEGEALEQARRLGYLSGYHSPQSWGLAASNAGLSIRDTRTWDAIVQVLEPYKDNTGWRTNRENEDPTSQGTNTQVTRINFLQSLVTEYPQTVTREQARELVATLNDGITEGDEDFAEMLEKDNTPVRGVYIEMIRRIGLLFDASPEGVNKIEILETYWPFYSMAKRHFEEYVD